MVSAALWVTLALVFSSGCKRDAPASSTDRRAILDEAGSRWHFESNPAARGASFAVPMESEIAALEQRLPAALRKAAPGSALDERSTAYLRQYVGWVDARGGRWVSGNFFCRDPMQALPEQRGRWRTHYVLVNDGGDCFFSFSYSLATGEFRDLLVNGDA